MACEVLPPSVPMSVITPFAQMEAWRSPLAVSDHPTITPASLMPVAMLLRPPSVPYGSVADLSQALRRAEAAHGQHEKRTGQRDANWPDWYAAYMVAEQDGSELPA